MGEKKQVAHKALYRKYRSKNLDEIVGQEHITKTLAQAVNQGKISHAYLFTGPRGVGKTSIARILAHEINELPYDNEKTHLDIIEIDAASNRRIDDIRDLREKVHIAPVSGKYKVYIIDEVHMLTIESFNALLKILEEPPAHVVFILATTEVHKLPATIVSRTQRHSFKSIPVDDVVKHLKHIAKTEKIDIDDEALELLAEHGDGSFRDSISLLDQMASGDNKVTADTVELLLGIAPRALIDQLLSAVTGGNSTEVLNIVSELVEKGITPSGISYQLLRSLRNTMLSGKTTAWQVNLIEKLMSVTSAPYPQLKLEAILLEASLAHQADDSNHTPPTEKAEVKKTPAKKEVEPEKKVNPAVTKEEKVEAPAKPKVKAEPVEASELDKKWPAFIEAIKAKNNSLYTIMRLSKPHLTKDTLQVAFGFEFHRKRLNEAKHKKLLAETANEVLGLNVEIEPVLDKALVEDKKMESIDLSPKAHEAHASLVDQIQDIMGGGEIVHA